MLWNSPSKFPILRHDDIHLWLAKLAQSAQETATFWGILNAEERQRADRLIIQRHRENFIVARGILRQLLSNYLNYPAREIKFTQGPFGKIEIHRLMPTPLIKFNLSHTGEYALFAFSLDRDLGVDIEHIRADIEIKDIAQRFFSTVETKTLLSLPADMQTQAFFNCWTRKEAFIKAIGQGLYYPLHEFDVDAKTNGEIKVDLNIHDKSLQNKTWNLFSIETVADYAAALVVEGVIELEKILKFKYKI